MDPAFVELLNSLVLGSTLNEIESQMAKANSLFTCREIKAVHYGALVMSHQRMFTEFLEMVAEHKYCKLKDRTPENRTFDGIMTTMLSTLDIIGQTDRIIHLFHSTSLCGSRCKMNVGTAQKCRRIVARHGYFGANGMRTKDGNLLVHEGRQISTISRYQLSSVRKARMLSPSGANNDKYLVRAYST